MQRRYRNTTTGRQRSYSRATSTGTSIVPSALWQPSNDTYSVAPRIWYDASDSSTITTATGVSEWRDKSLFGRHATQSSGTSQPALISNELNGRNVIRFDGSNDFLDYDGNVLGQARHFVIAVVSRRSNKSANFWIGGNVTTQYRQLTLGWNTNTQYMYSMANYDLTYTVAGYTSPVWEIWGTFVDTAGKKIILNGTQVTSNNQTFVMTSNTSGYIGRYTSNYYNGDIAEILVYRGFTDRPRIEGYLAWKWGLQGLLPVGHAYKNAAPTTTV